MITLLGTSCCVIFLHMANTFQIYRRLCLPLSRLVLTCKFSDQNNSTDSSLNFQDCDATLSGMEKNLADPVFMITTLDEAMIHIVAHGRGAAGADPPEAFQVFLNRYIPFWNEDDQGCDTVTWETVAPYKAYLTTTVRKRMNDIVRKLNEQLALAAEQLSGEGVFYIDGY